MRYILYAISLFLPFAGIIIKIVSNRRAEDAHIRRVGDICLLLSAAPMAILLVILGFHALMLSTAP